MEPENLRFGGGATETMLHPLVAVWLLVAIVLILTRPRGQALTVFLLSCFCIPIGQVVVLGTLHFSVLRILVITGLIRRAWGRDSSSRNKFPGGFNAIDQVVVLWTVSALVTLSLQWMNSTSLIHNLGDFLDMLGGYFVVRFLTPDGEAIRRTIKVLAVVCVIQGACMLNERINHFNVYGYLGGMPLEITIRDGKIRSQGVMGCLYAGAFGGALVPWLLWLWTAGKARIIALAGLAGAVLMAITSNSSTSLLALAGSVVGLAFWFMRKQMRLVRWALAGTLISLHLAMKAPVWALIAHIDLTGSSSGDHRYKLMDNCIRHFSDWWLIGYKYYNGWGYDMWDLCNQFVVVALTGGLLTLIFYITIFKRSFGAIGTARKQVNGDRAREWLLWCMGADLFANVVAHFGINYMTQMMMTMFPLLACISVAAFEAKQEKVRKAEPMVQQLVPALAATASYRLPSETPEEVRHGLFAPGRGLV
jgi:hypothetical protein